jgi:hypothetical protein
MKITAEIKKTLSNAGVEIFRNVHEEDNDYGDKAGDIFWTVPVNGRAENYYYRKWAAQEDAVMMAVDILRNKGIAVFPAVAQLADSIESWRRKGRMSDG